MTQALFTAMTGLNAGTNQLTVVSDNIANMNTTAYKTSRVDFQDIWYQTKTTGTNSTKVLGGTNPYQIGVGVKCASITKDFSAASTTSTGRNTDLAITGNGWFSVQNADGQTLLTRDGTFTMDENGYLCTAQGYKLMGMDSVTSSTGSTVPIKIPTAIKVIENPMDAASFAKQKVSALNNSETITAGSDNTQATYGHFEVVINDGAVGAKTVTVDLSNLTSDSTMQTLVNEINNSANGDFTASIVDGAIKFTAANAGDTLSFKSVAGGSNFVAQTDISNVNAVEEGGVNTYTTKILSMTAKISEVDDYTDDSTKLYKSLSFGQDGMMTVTYSDGSVLTVQAAEDGKSTYFSYTDAGGIIINDDVNNSGNAPLYVDPNVLSKANMQLQVVKVTNDSGLVAAGSNCYEIGVDCGKVTYTAAGINGTGNIATGALESSNVDLSEQFANMILAQRLVQANSQVFNKANDVLNTLVYLGQ